ncbi:hypothetical protein [Massilia sp. TS11]|uniref:hypothetical protein n=1 Tax=Massilia sp. TS11 TaxID=2908003 RepID=UPI001EDC8C5A|nr:hypothetical protein [Massilia sp. TS11]MCG2584434.1 hypothetical protein [Massilia sp. TS11]
MLVRRLCLLLCSLLLVACASQPLSLQEVRDFSVQSVKLTGYAELSTRFRDTYQREHPYLPPTADKQARENDSKRRALYGEFISVQKTLVLYMQTLGVLAGDARFDLSAQVDDLGASLHANAEVGLDQRHVDAYSSLTRLLTHVIASGYQSRSVETMVRDGDTDVQLLLEAMINLTRYYAKTHANEKRTVLGLFEVELPFTKPQDRLLATLARVHYLNKVTEYQLVEKRFDLAAQGLSKVALGHQRLREHLHDVHGEELRAQLRQIGADLRRIYNSLERDTI